MNTAKIKQFIKDTFETTEHAQVKEFAWAILSLIESEQTNLRDSMQLGFFLGFKKENSEYFIDHKEFLNQAVSGMIQDGIYVVISSDCASCSMLVKGLSETLEPSAYKIVDALYDLDFEIKSKLHLDYPTVLVYKDGNIIYKNEGVMFASQYEELLEAFAQIC